MTARYRGAEEIRRVAVIGAGLIGAGWVAAFLARGLSVAVFDPSPAAETKVRAHVAGAWPQLEALGLAADADPDAIGFHADLADALAGADFVQENTPEREPEKVALVRALDALLAPDILIASSTSSLPITALQADAVHPERCVLGHPFNPVHLIPLVEVGGGERTDRAAVDAAIDFYRALGKQPVRIEREIFGHIGNRLTSAMFREAVSLVADGVASVEDIDAAIRFGPALKWAIQGQFTTFHTSGGDAGLAGFLAHFAPGIERRWQTMRDPDLSSEALRAKLVAGMAAAAQGASVAEIAQRQDALLLELLKILRGPER